MQDSKDLQKDINLRRNKYAEFDLPMGPIAVVVGKDEDNITASYVAVDAIIYEIENPFKALDVAFKASHALDTEYNKDVSREFLFLHHAIYCIPTGAKKRKNKACFDKKVEAIVEEYKKSKY